MNNPPKVFIAYFHKDSQAKDELIKYLAVMEDQGEIEVWHDNEMLAGDKWEDAISNKLAGSDILLYLVSASGLASKNCNKELGEAIAYKNIKVIPIILEDCDWKNHQLSGFEALPEKGKPINEWKQEDEVKGWKNIESGIKRIINYRGTADTSPGTDVSITFSIANFLVMLNQLDLAIKSFSDVIKLEPDNVRAYANRGVAYVNDHNDKYAIEDFNFAIRKIIREITDKSADGDYIYRGEPEYYEEVSSNLYREIKEELKKIKADTSDFDINHVQKEILKEAKQYADEADELVIQRELQHYGGKTNLIDFTTDYLVALFFACDGLYSEDGRVILRKRNLTEEEKEINKLKNPKHRVLAQKSVFIKPKQGWIDPDKTISIPKNLKEPMLNYLRKHHDISDSTIYNDLHGFIIKQSIHRSAYTAFYKGFTLSDQEKYNEAKAAFSKAIKIKPNFAEAYINRGIVYSKKAKLALDISDKSSVEDNRNLAMSDYTKAIEFNPKLAEAYYNRGRLYDAKGDSFTDSAIQGYTKAIEIKPDFVEAYVNRGAAYSNKAKLALAISDKSSTEDNHNLAISDYSAAIELKPNDAYAYNNRGVTYGNIRKYHHAIQDYSNAISLNPDFAQAYYNRGTTWLVLREWDSAKTDLLTARGLEFDISLAFQKDFGSIEKFEQGLKITLPPDISKLLEPPDSDSTPS